MALKITRNNTAELLFSSVDPTDKTTPVALNNLSVIKFSIKGEGDTIGHALQIIGSPTSGQIALDASAGTITVTVTSTEATSLTAGQYRYDVQLTFSDGRIFSLVNDWLYVVDEVTVQGLYRDFLSFDDITVADVKEYHGADLADTARDAAIANIMRQTVEYIQRYCNKNFEPLQEYTESPRMVDYQTSFFLERYPLRDGYGVTIVENGTTLTEDDDFYVYKDTGEVTKKPTTALTSRNKFYYGYWYAQPGGITVTYTAGEQLPRDVLQVFFELVGIRAGLKTRTYQNNEGENFVTTINSIPKEMLDILDRHRRWYI